MKEENWLICDRFENDKVHLEKYNFRPESFWETILNHTSMNLVEQVLQVLNVGYPNLNHRIISYLLANEIICNAVTTNFDEYIEHEINEKYYKNNVKIKTNTELHNQCLKSSICSTYFKIHGTISNPSSLQFTFSKTRKLIKNQYDFLRACLQCKPLLIAGYSGFDDDIMPLIKELIAELPKVFIIVYPGSNEHEPIQGIQGLNVKIVEVDINKVILDWTLKQVASKKLSSALLTEKDVNIPSYEHIFKKAIDQLQIPQIPLLLSGLLEDTGNNNLGLSYAKLAEDASVDSRYSNLLTVELKEAILTQNEIMYAKTGQQHMANLFHKLAVDDNKITKNSVAKSTHMRIQHAFGIVCNPSSTEEELRRAEVFVVGAYALLNKGLIGGKKRLEFDTLRCLGRIRRRQKRYVEAINAYDKALEIYIDIKSHPFELAGTILDDATAMFLYAKEEDSNEWLNKSYNAYLLSKTIAIESKDHITHAQALLMLSQIDIFSEEFEGAKKMLQESEKLAKLTGDKELLNRIYNMHEFLLSARKRKEEWENKQKKSK